MRFLRSERVVDAAMVVVIAGADLSLMWLTRPGELALPGYDGPSLVGSALLVAAALPLLWRRRAPVAVLVATTALSLGAALVPVPSELIAPLAAIYTVAARSGRRTALAALVGLAVLMVLPAIVFDDPGALGVMLVGVGTAWLLGDAQRARAAHAAALADRMRAMEAERERSAELAVVSERTRIARELHDVVAHSITVMVIQAGAARRVVAADPDRARVAARQVADTGRQALVELRHLLGVLREEDSEAAYEPQPGLRSLGNLLADYAGSPLRISLSMEGEPQPLTPGADLSAYRIIQESLTNALRHAGPARVEVRLCWLPDRLQITVADDGRGAPAPAVERDGHGLRGMAERANLVGGRFEAGPRPGGGFLVSAALPREV